MYYFDNSATTRPKNEVIDTFLNYMNVTFDKEMIDNEKNVLLNILGCDYDVIYTSGSTEANNMAIKGIAFNNLDTKGHIISIRTEHSSVIETLKYLEKLGFVIDYVDLIDGIVDLNHLKKLLLFNPILVTISSVNSETGVIQPIEEIGKLLKEKNILFHCDMTQSMGKIKLPFSNIDLISFSGHKIGGLKGIGVLLKNKNINLKPIIYGKRSYSYGLIRSLNTALSLAFTNIDYNYKYISNINRKLREDLNNIEWIHINSHDKCLPYILNISILDVKPETFLHKLESQNIFISTKSACSSDGKMSSSVYYLTNNEKYASSSIRISLSCDNTIKDIRFLVEEIVLCYNDIVKL